MIINITATLHFRGQALQGHAGPAKAAIGKLGLSGFMSIRISGQKGQKPDLYCEIEFCSFHRFSLSKMILNN